MIENKEKIKSLEIKFSFNHDEGKKKYLKTISKEMLNLTNFNNVTGNLVWIENGKETFYKIQRAQKDYINLGIKKGDYYIEKEADILNENILDQNLKELESTIYQLMLEKIDISNLKIMV